MVKPRYGYGFNVWLEHNGKYLTGEKEARILECINTIGSFMGTAKSLGISYAHAWNTIDRISKILGEQIIEARRGGESGGGARLTEAGFLILKEYKNLEKQMAESLSYREKRPMVKSKLFSHDVKAPDLSIIGSHCIGIEIIIDLLMRELKFSPELAYVGSSGGLAAVMLGEADIAGVHLLDDETGQYNLPFLKKYFIDDKAVVVRGYMREQGFLLAKGNPKNIRGFEDLLRNDVKFVNRSLGSGTRAMLDREMKKIAEKIGIKPKEISKRIRGYNIEVRSHIEVAKAVSHGKAYVGLGIRAVAEKYELDFIPLAEEYFDFVIDKKRLKKPLVNSFIEMLGSDRFKTEVKKHAPGIKIIKDTGNLIYEP
ncbi:MAG: LysR family transcriptional regulator [archaeon]|nr:LysR family transcriptional regulator [archaeon]